MYFIIFIIFLVTICCTDIKLYANAANVNGPFMTPHINDISGSDVFKITVGLTGVGIGSGLMEVCVSTNELYNEKLCNISDIGKEFLHDFGNSTCPTCIITVGTFIFPADKIPIDSIITVCADTLLKEKASQNCNTTQNNPNPIPQDIVIELEI